MAFYRFARDYRAGAIVGKQGDVVNLDDDVAAWVRRDSPGCLVAMADAPESEEAATVEDAEARAVETPPADRQLKAPTRKREA